MKAKLRKSSSGYGWKKADRQGGDYIPTATFEASDVSASLQKAREFMDLIRGLLGAG